MISSYTCGYPLGCCRFVEGFFRPYFGSTRQRRCFLVISEKQAQLPCAQGPPHPAYNFFSGSALAWDFPRSWVDNVSRNILSPFESSKVVPFAPSLRRPDKTRDKNQGRAESNGREMSRRLVLRRRVGSRRMIGLGYAEDLPRGGGIRFEWPAGRRKGLSLNGQLHPTTSMWEDQGSNGSTANIIGPAEAN
jgi:hypothetical protein